MKLPWPAVDPSTGDITMTDNAVFGAKPEMQPVSTQ